MERNGEDKDMLPSCSQEQEKKQWAESEMQEMAIQTEENIVFTVRVVRYWHRALNLSVHIVKAH